MHLKTDTEFESLIPPLSDDEMEVLELSIQAEGCREPIIISKNNTIIDGHHRYKICTKHGIKFETRVMDFASRAAVCIWIIRNQFGRRNLTAMVRGSLALKLKPLFAAEAEARSKLGKSVDPAPNLAQGQTDDGIGENESKIGKRGKKPVLGQTRDQLADIAGMSHGTLAKVEKIEESPVKELSRMTKAGKVSVDAASAVADLPEKKQRAVVAGGAKAVKAAAKKIRESKPVKTNSPFPDASLIVEALAAVAKLKGVFTQLLGDAGANKSADPVGIHMASHRQEWPDQLNMMRHNLKQSRPYSVCPYCEGSGRKCEGCKGAGWAGKDIFDRAPKDYQARVKGTIRE